MLCERLFENAVAWSVLHRAEDRHRESTARDEHAVDLSERGYLVGEELKALLAHCDVEGCIGQRHAEGTPLTPLDLQSPRCRSSCLKHARVQIETDDPSI